MAVQNSLAKKQPKFSSGGVVKGAVLVERESLQVK